MSTQRSVINSKQWYNYADPALYVWGGNFGVNVSENEEVLGVDAGELETIQDSITNFQTKLDALAAAKSAYEAAVIEKDEARSGMIDALRPFVAQFQANPNIPVKVFESLEIPARGTTGPRTAPSIPTSLVANANANGSVVLTFNKAGNSATTTYAIQSSTGEGWSTIWTGTRKKVTLDGFTPGVETLFRVFAVRNNIQSLPSNVVGIYQTGDTVSLSVAA